MTLLPLERSACPLGCNADDEFVVDGHDRLNHGPGKFSVLRCRQCGLMRTDPRPTAAAIGAYYPDDYTPYKTSAAVAPAMQRSTSALRRMLLSAVDSRSQWLPPLPPGHLLEFGCASGGFLARMRTEGWQVEGVDISASATARGRALGLAVHTGTLDTMPPPTAPYDMVVGWMALEHLPDPLAALRKLNGWTRPGGRLAVSMPDASALEFTIFGKRWYALHLPAHQFHFTPASLDRVLQAAGWRLDRIHYQRSAGNLVGSLGHLLEDLGLTRAGRWLVRSAAQSPGLHRWLFPLAIVLGALRQSGRMTVWATKPDA